MAGVQGFDSVQISIVWADDGGTKNTYRICGIAHLDVTPQNQPGEAETSTSYDFIVPNPGGVGQFGFKNPTALLASASIYPSGVTVASGSQSTTGQHSSAISNVHVSNVTLEDGETAPDVGFVVRTSNAVVVDVAFDVCIVVGWTS